MCRRLGRRRGKIDDRPARVADRVMMRRGVGVVTNGRPETQRTREAAAREDVQRVVDGREAHRRELRTKPLEEILRRRMRPIAGEQLHDRTTLRRELEPRAPELREHRLRRGLRLHRRRTVVRTIPNCNGRRPPIGYDDRDAAPERADEWSTTKDDAHIWFSPDELTAYLAVGDVGVQSSRNLFFASRTTTQGAFSTSIALTALDSPQEDDNVSVTEDIPSMRRDIWRATRPK